MRKPVLRSLIGVALIAVLVTAGVLIVHAFSSDGTDVGAHAECTVPAVSGAPVTVVVEGPATSGAGAAGSAAAGASSTASTTVTTAPDVFLSAVQVQHASTINAVGLRRGLPERARVIAIATAWQESGLRNLPGGDRDSVGLFQQRPSQGWGTAAQIIDPVYAAGAFYDALLKVTGWPSMSLTKAAQQVQYSAFPDAYAKWEPSATSLARALGGADPVRLSCRAGAQPPTAAAPTRKPVAGTAAATPGLSALLGAAQAELGGISVASISAGGQTAVVSVSVSGTLAPAAQARALAAWAVAHGASFSVSAVAVQGRRWTDHAWVVGAAPGAASQISITVS